MKPLLKLTAIAALALTACQKAETTISVNLTDLPERTVFQIIKWDGDGGKVVFADTINGGTYSHTYKCDSIDDGNSYSVSTILGNTAYGHRRIYVTDDYSAIITGSDIYSNGWNVDCKNPRQQFQNKMNDATKDYLIEYLRISVEMREQGKNQEERRALYEKMDSMRIKIDEAELMALETIPVDEYWMEEFANSCTSRINYEGTEYSSYPKLTELYKRLSDADKATPIGKRITLDLFGKAPAVGDKIIDYDLYDADGNVHHLSEFQGKWMLLDFSSYYCGPCRMFAPTVKYLYEKGVGNNFEIVTITLDTKRQFEEMVANEKYVSPLWNDRDGRNGIFALYKIPGYPTFYVVSPDGTITDTWFGTDQQRITNAIRTANAFPKPEFRTEENLTTVINPSFSNTNCALFIDKIEYYKDSTVLNCTYAGAGSYCISSDSYLSVNSKRVSTITKADIEMNKFIQVPVGEVGHCRLTFEPLPKNATEFDFIESDCPTCFRIEGIKVNE